MNYLIMCKSLTYAQRAVKILERVGIIVSVLRAPQSLGTEGCAYCLKMSERRLTEAMRILRSSGLKLGKVYKADNYGAYSEVFV